MQSFPLLNRSRRICRLHDQAFSLIEILIVVCIVSLLLALGSSMLSDFQKSSVLSKAGNRVVDMASLAKQMALSRNTITALVTHKVPAADANAFTVLEIGSDRIWKQITEWAIFPDYINVKDDSSTAYLQLPSPDALQLKLRGENTAASDLVAVVFYPDGRLLGDSNTLRTIRMTHASSPADHYDIVFNTDTAQVRVLRP